MKLTMLIETHEHTVSGACLFSSSCALTFCGWKGDSQVNVAVNNQVGVVVSETKRKELQAKLKEIQDADDSEKQSSAPKVTPPAPQVQLRANLGAENTPSGAQGAASQQ
jgi:hypothetical protein